MLVAHIEITLHTLQKCGLFLHKSPSCGAFIQLKLISQALRLLKPLQLVLELLQSLLSRAAFQQGARAAGGAVLVASP